MMNLIRKWFRGWLCRHDMHDDRPVKRWGHPYARITWNIIGLECTDCQRRTLKSSIDRGILAGHPAHRVARKWARENNPVT